MPYDVDMGPIASEDGASETAQTLFRSDLFGHLYELIRVFPGVTGLLQSVIRIEIVIDANVVLGEIRFRLKRRNPQARSDLGEAIDSGIVIAIAPQYLAKEIDDEHLSRILDGTGKTLSDARREWNDFRTKIRLYDPMSDGNPALSAIDPDDVAYAMTCEETGAHAVHSRDKHLKKMGVPVVKGTPDRALRDCARSGAVVMGITATSGFAVTITYASIRGVWLLLEKALEGFRPLPSWAKLLLIGCGVAVVAQPRFRAGVAERWAKLRDNFGSLAPNLLDAVEFVGQLACGYQEAEQQAARSKAELQALLPTPRPKTLIQHARSVALRTDRPLSLEELLRLMKLDGYQATTRNARAGLRAALRASRQFLETESGEWLMERPVIVTPILPLKRRSSAIRRKRVTNIQRLRRRKSPPVTPSVE